MGIAAAACVLAGALLGPEALPIGLGAAAALVLLTLAVTWYDTRGPGAELMRLARRWEMLPGARAVGRAAIAVHDGMQPLTIRLSRARRGERGPRAIVQTPADLRPVALRAWPAGGAPPTLDPLGAPHGGPTVERAPLVETLFAGQVQVEANDEPSARDLLGGEVTAALLVLTTGHGDAFDGLTYDGALIGVHLSGPVVGDPEEAARLARVLWRACLDR